jgi:hypothetical protein
VILRMVLDEAKMDLDRAHTDFRHHRDRHAVMN